MKLAARAWLSSFSGFMVATATLFGITGVAFASGGAIFNPGSLSNQVGAPLGGTTSHSDIQQCSACHTSPWETATMADRCIACHTDITAQLQGPSSLHSLVKFGQSDLNCRACHTEHHGSTAPLTQIPPDWDPHGQFGFSLNQHRLRMDGAPFECKDCHEKGYSNPFDQLVCATCHLKVDQAFAQDHILTFWTDCQACHDGLDTHGSTFDHNQAPFKLVGLHAVTACSKCHLNARNLLDLQVTAQDCFVCHEKDDQHFGQFGTKCGVCHTAEGWGESAQFDHNLANFKLTGKHVTVVCASCHVNNKYKGIPSDCFSCHSKDDKHNGQFGTDCASCHTSDGWNKTVDHSQFVFKLEGKHSVVACNTCHKDTDFKKTPMNCVACHARDDAHDGQFGAECESCHTPENWTSATFNHNSVSFKLTAHQTKSDGSAFVCKDCHVNGYSGPFDRNTCGNCHLRINQALSTEHFLTFGTDCMACHDGIDSRGSAFDHEKVSFRLVGKHVLLKCSACHASARSLDGLKAAPQDCVSCHAKDDNHKGQLGAQCGACHSPSGWKPATVDHSRFAFKLEGKHSVVSCTNCHVNGVFKGAPKDCASCHAKNDAHAGSLGNQCGTCHSPKGWSPAVFNHNSVSFKLTAHQTKSDGSAVVCKDCHVNGYSGPFDRNTCGNCHLRINQALSTEHFLTFGTDCLACHDGIDSRGSAFDHEKVSFRLVGKHVLLKCSACHANARSLDGLKAAPQDCVSCHAKDDNHKGQLGAQCGACHLPSGWKPATVDHSRFAFKLEGKHSVVSCTNCHINGVFKGAPKDCASCHAKNDAHAGSLGNQCGTCHSPKGWKPAAVDHSKFSFRLDGKHISVVCASCHQKNVFKGTPKDCVSCHAKDDPHKGGLGNQCGACHKSAGWSPAAFNHNSVLFKLTAHQIKSDGTAFVCKDCHVNGYSKPFDHNSCGNCHLRINQAFSTSHFLAFGTNCVACHDGVESLGSGFTHNKGTFKLAGKHTLLACSRCHANARTLNDLKAAPQACISCHLKDDRHNGQFGTECAACHSSDGWSSAKVDHSRFAFKLVGKHAVVACQNCHINGQFKGAPQDCASCHARNDPHGGKLGAQCSKCHTANGWKPTTFDHKNSNFQLTGKHTTLACALCHKDKFFVGAPTGCASCHGATDPHSGALGAQCGTCHITTAWKPSTFNHANSSFKLTGRHATVLCGACHKDMKFKGTPATCFACHAAIDRHGGKYGTNCGSCHSTTAWKPATFNHNLSSFPLTGAHVNTACSACHLNNVFIGTPKDCNSCHKAKDPHAGVLGTNCAACHTTTAWKPSTFNHANSSFKLTGRHATVLCGACHKDMKFKGTPATCFACHAATDRHGGKYGTNCGSCHSTTAWKPATFNHNLSSFPLTGAHVNTACSACHLNNVFIGTPKDCNSCHKARDPHAGKYGTNCATCHTTTAWRPATFRHAFPLNHGGSGNVACATCHPNTTSSYTCFGCHEHTINNMASDHDEVGNYSPTACATCHPNGNGD